MNSFVCVIISLRKIFREIHHKIAFVTYFVSGQSNQIADSTILMIRDDQNAWSIWVINEFKILEK